MLPRQTRATRYVMSATVHAYLTLVGVMNALTTAWLTEITTDAEDGPPEAVDVEHHVEGLR